MSRRAAFLDRDGVLNVRPPEHEYVRSLEQFRWLPGAASGAAQLARAGFVLVVVSNQRGIARGLVTDAVLREIEQRIQSGLAVAGARIESFRYCPHDIEDACECRKPKPGLLLSAAAELELDLAGSWIIGDSDSDIAAGRTAGTHTALIGSNPTSEAAELTAPTLASASSLILEWEQRHAA